MPDSEKLDLLIREFREKAEKDAQFRGTMLEFKATTERRLSEGNQRMTAIEESITEKTPVCVLHSTVLEDVAQAKEDIKDLKKRDLEHDGKIAEVKTETKILEVKLSPMQDAMLKIGAVGGGGSIATIILVIIAKYFFHIDLQL